MKKLIFFALLLFAACKPTPEYVPKNSVTVVCKDPLVPTPKIKGFDIKRLESPIRKPEYSQPSREPVYK
jgi:hypothetical protein